MGEWGGEVDEWSGEVGSIIQTVTIGVCMWVRQVVHSSTIM